MKKILLFLFLFFLGHLYCEAEIPSGIGLEDFLTGKELKMEHSFKNNILAIGNKLQFTGTSFEDVVLFGINVEFNGFSKKDVYIVGDSVTVSGSIKGNLKIMARNLKMESLNVEGNINILSPQVFIYDNVSTSGITKIWSRDVEAGGKHSSLYIRAKNVIFTKNIDIKNKLVVMSKEKPALPLGTLKNCEFKYEPLVPRPAQTLLSTKFIKLYSFLSLCFPFILMVFITPRILQETIEIIEKKPVWIFFTGLLLLIIMPLVFILLMITVIGAPLGLIFLTFYISLLYICRGFTCIVIGKLILWKLKESKIKIILGIFLGTGIFVLLTAIPRVGYFFQMIFIIFGFGGLAIGRIRMFLKLRKENLV